jgi:hypothetical protein
MKLRRFGDIGWFKSLMTGVLISLAFLIMPVAHAWNYSETVSPNDVAVASYFWFPEMGTVTDSSSSNCGSTTASPCFGTQLNSDTSVGDVSDFYQAALIAKPTALYWQDWIGCNSSCSYSDSGGAMSSSLLNTTNNIFVLSINAGSSSVTWTVTSCNYSFSTAAYSFTHLTFNTSTCTASNSWTDTAGSSYFPTSTVTYIENLPVGLSGCSTATMGYFQERGELFNYNNGAYSGSTSSLTCEGSNVTPDTGTFGTVIPLCYFGPGTSAPC